MIEVLIAVTAGAAAAVLVPRGRDRLLRQRLRASVVVTLKSRASFRGVLYEVDERSVVLRNAEALDAGGAGVVPVDGEVLLARADVEFLQRP